MSKSGKWLLAGGCLGTVLVLCLWASHELWLPRKTPASLGPGTWAPPPLRTGFWGRYDNIQALVDEYHVNRAGQGRLRTRNFDSSVHGVPPDGLGAEARFSADAGYAQTTALRMIREEVEHLEQALKQGSKDWDGADFGEAYRKLSESAMRAGGEFDNVQRFARRMSARADQIRADVEAAKATASGDACKTLTAALSGADALAAQEEAQPQPVRKTRVGSSVINLEDSMLILPGGAVEKAYQDVIQRIETAAANQLSTVTLECQPGELLPLALEKLAKYYARKGDTAAANRVRQRTQRPGRS